jgi:hypothetical protein
MRSRNTLSFVMMKCLTVTVVLLPILVLTVQVQSQTSLIDSRQAIVEEIKAFAARHLKANSPMRTDAVVTAFSGNRAGRTSNDIESETSPASTV